MTIYKVTNGETCWILITYHFNRMKHGDTRIPKASPIYCLRNFLNQYPPTCNEKYIHLDKGGEFFNDQYLKDLLQTFGYTIHNTGADTSNQNGSV